MKGLHSEQGLLTKSLNYATILVMEEKLRLKLRKKIKKKRGNREELKKKERKKKKKKGWNLALANSNQRLHLSLKKDRQLLMLWSANTLSQRSTWKQKVSLIWLIGNWQSFQSLLSDGISLMIKLGNLLKHRSCHLKFHAMLKLLNVESTL